MLSVRHRLEGGERHLRQLHHPPLLTSVGGAVEREREREMGAAGGERKTGERQGGEKETEKEMGERERQMGGGLADRGESERATKDS